MLMMTFGYAQEKKHIAESKDLVGFWGILMPSWKSGEMSVAAVGSYKVINPDGTFYVFFAPKNKGGVSGIILYGNYEITSDSTYTEHIIRNLNSTNKTDSHMKYKFLSEDVIVASFTNEEVANGREIKEIWVRMKMLGEKPIMPSIDELEKEIKEFIYP